MSKEKRFVIQVDPLEIEDDAIFDNKELRLYECQSDMMSDICSLLNKQESKIADLEAKLAESEEQKETLRISQSSTHKTLMQLNDELLKTQKQLAESEKRLVNCVDFDTWQKTAKENAELKQQLTEKEKERQHLKDWLDDEIMTSVDHETFYAMQDEYEERLKQADKDKISFCIEKLKKVKEFCDNPKYRVEYEYYTDCWTTAIDKDSLLNEIDNQIEELKKEMK